MNKQIPFVRSLLIFFILALFPSCRSAPPPAGDDGFVTGDHAYIGHNKWVQVFDISRPDDPRFVTEWTVPGDVRRVVTRGDTVYVIHFPSVQSWDTAAGPPDGGVQIVDVADPRQPEIIGYYHTPDLAEDIAFRGDIAYVADWSGLRVADFSNPRRPRALISLTEGMSAVEVVDDVLYSVWGSCSLRTAHCSGGLWTADLADPAAPLALSTVQTNKPASLGYRPGYDVVLIDDRAYVAGLGLWWVDAADPAALQVITGTVPVGGAYQAQVASDGRYLYLASDPTIRVFDTADTVDPVQIAVLDLWPTATDLTWHDDYLLAATMNGLYVIDVGEPERPFIAATTNPAESPRPYPTVTPVK